jgi:hypothetical protein
MRTKQHWLAVRRVGRQTYASILVLLLLMAFPGGCGTKRYTFHGDEDAVRDDIAVVRLDNEGGAGGFAKGLTFDNSPDPVVYEVDGKRGESSVGGPYGKCYGIGWDPFKNTIEFELTPGQHVLKVGYKQTLGNVHIWSSPVDIDLVAEAGKTYTIEIELYVGDQWDAKIVEVGQKPKAATAQSP